MVYACTYKHNFKYLLSLPIQDKHSVIETHYASACDVIRMILAYQTKLNISGRTRATSVLPIKEVIIIVILSELCNTIKKRLGTSSCPLYLRLRVHSFVSVRKRSSPTKSIV